MGGETASGPFAVWAPTIHDHLGLPFGGLHVLAVTERCPRCGRHVGRERATFACDRAPFYRYPPFTTSDGFHVGLKKFRELALAHGFTGVEFVPLENGRFVLKVARQVPYDLTTSQVTQEDWCPECQTFRRNLTLTGSHPLAADEAPIGPFEVVESRERWGWRWASTPRSIPTSSSATARPPCSRRPGSAPSA